MGQTILAAGAAEISIWHNNNDGERYTLLQSASDFGVDATTGLVTAAMNMVIDIYDITLQLRDESLALTASRALRLVDPSRWALLRFLEQIEADEIAWTDADWDGDGIENPYDWTPTVYSGVTVNLTLDGADPWPIYNVWQLQAIDGVSVSADGTASAGFTLFGAARFGGELSFVVEYRRDADARLERGRFSADWVYESRRRRRSFCGKSERRRIRDLRPFGGSRCRPLRRGVFGHWRQRGGGVVVFFGFVCERRRRRRRLCGRFGGEQQRNCVFGGNIGAGCPAANPSRQRADRRFGGAGE